MLRGRGRLLRLLLAGIVLAGALSVFVATRSSDGERSVADCPDTAMTCPGQSAPPDDPVPPTRPGTTVPGTTVPGAGSGTPVPLPTVPSPTTGSPGGGPAKPPLSGPCASAAACGFPDARTTGPRTAIAAHNTGAMTVKTDGMVIRGWNITGSLDVYANNVTVIDTRITSDNWWGVNLRPGFSGLRILHSEITAVPGKGPDNGGVDYAVSNMGESSVEVGWNDISVFGNALSMGQGNLHDNYVHDIVPFRNLGGEWQHTDAVISGGGNKGQLIIRHNTLLNPTSTEQGASAGIGLFADTGVVSNTTVDGNWIAGGAYALYGGNKGATGIKVTNNVFSTQFHPKCGVYGPVTAWNAGGAGNVWSNNRMSTGVPVAAGSLV